MPRKKPTLVLKKVLRTSKVAESVADSPVEALRKTFVSILSGNVCKLLEKKAASNEKCGSRLVAVASFNQRYRAFVMKKLSRRPNCHFSTVSSFQPISAAMSTAQILSTTVVGLGMFYGADYLEIFPNTKEREYRKALAAGLEQYMHEEMVIYNTKIEKLKSYKDGQIIELQASLKELKNEVKELKKENMEKNEMVVSRLEKLESSSWFAWLFRS